MIVHPDLLLASKEFIGPGYIVYLGPKLMWDPSETTSPFKQTDISGKALFQTQDDFMNDERPNAGYIPNEVVIPKSTDQLIFPLKEPVLFSPPDMNLDNYVKCEDGYWYILPHLSLIHI